MAWVASDAAAELRQQIEKLVQRRINDLDAKRGAEMPFPVRAPLNYLGGSIEAAAEGSFATGYDTGTGETVTPFQWGISTWNGGDVWTG